MNMTTATHVAADSGVPAHARDFSLTGRVVIITGGAQGIGRELVRQVSAAGAIGVVADINGERARSVAAEIEAAGGQATAVQVDVTDPGSTEALAATVLAKYGRIDALVNNAALFATLGKQFFDQIPLEEWEHVMRVNVTGPFLCTRAVLPTMRAAKWGRIVHMSSDSVTKGVVNYLHYVTSKSALIGMTNAMARELGRDGITVNAIRPGAVATEVDRTVNPTIERRRAQLEQQCVPKGQEPWDLVGLVMFLCCPASSFITGQTIACDGGYTHSS